MNIPELFRPKKNIEKKIQQLLKERTEKKVCSFIDDSAEHLFPNFIDYLKEEYGPLVVRKRRNEIVPVWSISTEEKNRFVNLGSIKMYITNKSSTSEYGYEIEIHIERKLKKLIYREGYYCYDSMAKNVVSSKHPLRYDKEKGIPFP